MPDLLEWLRSALAGQYEVERELGRGGMATVFLAHDVKHDRPVALKVLRPELAAALGSERFLREIQIAARLVHPHILPLYDSGQAQGFLYYAMPYLPGESLRDRMAREGPLAVDQAVQIAREIADALAYAHHFGVVHRDIKPENILFEAGHAVVSDFGIARAASHAAAEYSGQTRLTETGLALGTPAYMSPERWSGSGEIDARSDLYSLGCVLYEMLAGAPPYAGASAQDLMARHTLDPAPSVRALRPDLPPHLDQIIQRTLAKAPEDRFASAAELARALAPAGAPATPTRGPAPRPGGGARTSASPSRRGPGRGRLGRVPAPPSPEPERRSTSRPGYLGDSPLPPPRGHAGSPVSRPGGARRHHHPALQCAPDPGAFDQRHSALRE